MESRERQERLTASWRQQEAELRQNFTDRANDAEQSSVSLGAEVAELRRKLLEAESDGTKQERQAAHLHGQLAAVQAQLGKSSDDLTARNADIARTQKELEASQFQVQRLTQSLSDERKEMQVQNHGYEFHIDQKT